MGIKKLLRKLKKKLKKNTSRADHKKPLSHEEERFKIKNNQDIDDNEGRNKHDHNDGE